MRTIIVPLGVTRETVEGLLRGLPQPDMLIVVTVPGYEQIKKPIIDVLEGYAHAVGATLHTVVVKPGDEEAAAEVYGLIAMGGPSEVYLIGVTGSRYLLPILSMVLLKYWRDTGARVYLVHGVEGEEASIEPLPGFFAPVMRVSTVQKRILRIVYESSEPVSGKDLIERYGFTRSVYYVLADLERKGLLVVRRNRIEKTLPGRLMYALLRASGELP